MLRPNFRLFATNKYEVFRFNLRFQKKCQVLLRLPLLGGGRGKKKKEEIMKRFSERSFHPSIHLPIRLTNNFTKISQYFRNKLVNTLRFLREAMRRTIDLPLSKLSSVQKVRELQVTHLWPTCDSFVASLLLTCNCTHETLLKIAWNFLKNWMKFLWDWLKFSEELSEFLLKFKWTFLKNCWYSLKRISHNF